MNHNLLDEIFQIARVERWLSCSKFDHDAAEGPKVGLVAINTIILEKFRSHVKWGSLFSGFSTSCRVCGMSGRPLFSRTFDTQVRKISNLLGEPEVTELQLTELVHEDIAWFQITKYDALRMQIT